MEGLGRPDRYVIYRWDSDAVHSSLTGLGYLVDHTLDEVVELGNGGDVGGRLARIVAAWDIAGDLYEIVADELGFALAGWAEQHQQSTETLEALYAEI